MPIRLAVIARSPSVTRSARSKRLLRRRLRLTRRSLPSSPSRLWRWTMLLMAPPRVSGLRQVTVPFVRLSSDRYSQMRCLKAVGASWTRSRVLAMACCSTAPSDRSKTRSSSSCSFAWPSDSCVPLRCCAARPGLSLIFMFRGLAVRMRIVPGRNPGASASRRISSRGVGLRPWRWATSNSLRPCTRPWVKVSRPWWMSTRSAFKALARRSCSASLRLVWRLSPSWNTARRGKNRECCPGIKPWSNISTKTAFTAW